LFTRCNRHPHSALHLGFVRAAEEARPLPRLLRAPPTESLQPANLWIVLGYKGIRLDCYHSAVDKTAVVGQENNGFGDLIGFTHAPERDLARLALWKRRTSPLQNATRRSFDSVMPIYTHGIAGGVKLFQTCHGGRFRCFLEREF
jgi:hypothetical protein